MTDAPAPRPRRLAPTWVRESRALSAAWKTGVAIAGGLVLVGGIVMLITPGPAFVLIPAGLALLATEFAWAARWFRKAQQAAEAAKERASNTTGTQRALTVIAGLAATLAAASAWVWLFGVPDFAVPVWEYAANRIGFVPSPPS